MTVTLYFLGFSIQNIGYVLFCHLLIFSRAEFINRIRDHIQNLCHCILIFNIYKLCLTVLAALAVLYPFMSEDTEILPDFEHKVFQGRFAVGGKVKVSHIACVAWRLFWNKDVRSSYKDIKNFEW